MGFLSGLEEEDILQPVAEHEGYHGCGVRYGLHAGAVQSRDVRDAGLRSHVEEFGEWVGVSGGGGWDTFPGHFFYFSFFFLLY